MRKTEGVLIFLALAAHVLHSHISRSVIVNDVTTTEHATPPKPKIFYESIDILYARGKITLTCSLSKTDKCELFHLHSQSAIVTRFGSFDPKFKIQNINDCIIEANLDNTTTAYYEEYACRTDTTYVHIRIGKLFIPEDIVFSNMGDEIANNSINVVKTDPDGLAEFECRMPVLSSFQKSLWRQKDKKFEDPMFYWYVDAMPYYRVHQQWQWKNGNRQAETWSVISVQFDHNSEKSIKCGLKSLLWPRLEFVGAVFKNF